MCVVNKSGMDKPFLRLFVAVCIILCLLTGLRLYFSGDASLQQPSVKRPVLSNPEIHPSNTSRRTPGELKQRALQRTPAAPATNSAAPFVSTLGPGATTYLGGMAALRALPPILSTDLGRMLVKA